MDELQAKDSKKHISPAFFYAVTFIALAIGFLGGIVFTLLRSELVLPRQMPDAAGINAERQQMINSLLEKTRLNPDDHEAWKNLGDAYFDTGQFDNAIGAYQKYLAAHPEDANVWTDLGIMYRRRGQPQEAVEAFNSAIKADPRHEASRFNKGIVLFHDLQDTEAAIRAWEELLAINPIIRAPNGQSLDQMLQQLKKQQAAEAE